MDFNAEPFWDDFESTNGAKDENYMKILFRPEYAVQARELTQIQSILQNQIKNFGDHVFTDGSPVTGGHLSLNTKAQYLKLDPVYNNVDVDSSEFIDKVIFNSNGVRSKVIAVDDTQQYPTLMVTYMSGGPFTGGDVIETITGNPTAQLILDSTSTGIGSTVSINDGIFYVDGYFVQVAGQTIVLDSYSNTPSFRVGLEIDDVIVDENDDANLLDPAQDSFNYQAPGAARYKFSLNLAKRSLTSIEDQKFFELLRVENGVVTKQVDYPIYSELEKTLARRTYDESGDYIVKDFSISVAANTTSDDYFVASISPGKAYINGYEFETVGSTVLNIPKARSQNTSSDYDLSMNYGNYLYVSNVISTNSAATSNTSNGMFDITKLPTIDLHCVPSCNINTTSLLGYNTTYMGSATVLNVIRKNSKEYAMYLSNVNMVSNVATVASPVPTISTITLPAYYSNLVNAYANTTIKVLDGAAAGDVKKVLSYSGTDGTKTLTIQGTFTVTPTASCNIAFLYGITDTDSMVEVSTNKTVFNVSMDISSTSKDAANSTIMYDPSINSFIYKLPEDHIANNSITKADFVYEKFIKGLTLSTTGQATITLSGDETFNFGTDGSNVGVSANDNIICVVSANNSVTANGEILNLSGSGGGGVGYVSRTTNQSITLNLNRTTASATAKVDVIVKVRSNWDRSLVSTNPNLRTKTKIGDDTTTTLSSGDLSGTGTTSVTGQTSVKVNTTNGFIWFTDPTVINKNPQGKTSLYLPDVFRIKKIYSSGDNSVDPNPSNAIDITDRFYLNSGQTLTTYDHASIVLKSNATVPAGRIVVLAQYYDHSSSPNGYFTVDSYLNVSDYVNNSIPTFITSDGTEYNLRDCIDFRATRVKLDIANTYYGSKTPSPSDVFRLTYAYYVPRIDKIVLTKSKEMKLLSGVPAKNPVPPMDNTNSMELFRLSIPAYTYFPSDVNVTLTKHKRYTMQDIGNLEQRVQNIEYYTALSLSEKTAKDKVLLYKDNATQKEKYGILVDSFIDFSTADTLSPDFKCSIENNKLGAYANLNSTQLQVGAYDSSLIYVGDKSIVLNYTETTAIEQPSATTQVTVNPFLFGKFDGNLKLNPDSDFWFSLNIPPDVLETRPILPTTPSGVIVSSQNYYANPVTSVYGAAPTTSTGGIPTKNNI